MSYALSLHKKITKDNRISAVQYRFESPCHQYLISISNTRFSTNKKHFIVQFDTVDQMNAALGPLPPKLLNEGVALMVFATVAKAIEAFYSEHSNDVDRINLSGNSVLYKKLVERFTNESNADCANILCCD